MNLWARNTRAITKIQGLRVLPHSQKWMCTWASFQLLAEGRAGIHLLPITLTSSQGKETWALGGIRAAACPDLSYWGQGLREKPQGASILLFRCSLGKIGWFTIQDTKEYHNSGYCDFICHSVQAPATLWSSSLITTLGWQCFPTSQRE